jgi:hypothetical protein
MPPSREQELAVLRAVTYAALFDYPLTLTQLRESLAGVAADETTIAAWCRQGALLQSAVERRGGLFFPAGRADLIDTRRRREGISHSLLQQDRRILSLVSRMPFVQMVALSGSLAHLNAEGSADVDLFVITQAKRVWLVTVTVLLISKALGWRRRLCMNYVVSERHMAMAPADLFTANQIIHLRPLFGETVYKQFLDANPFVARCYPNFRPRQVEAAPRPAWPARDWALAIVAPVAERLCRAVYRWHLRRRASSWQSSDQVRLEDECLKLHTSSHRLETMARFEAAMADALAAASVRWPIAR